MNRAGNPATKTARLRRGLGFLAGAVVASGAALVAVPAGSAGAGAAPAPVPGLGANPTGNPLGPLVNVSASCSSGAVTPSCWQYYQPAPEFCIPDPDDVYEFPPGTDNTATGSDCEKLPGGQVYSSNEKGLFEVKLSDVGGVDMQAPPLCGTCVRLFIDYSKIPAASSTTASYARGHAYVRLMSFNAGYTSNPFAHSPNIKNLTNDTLVAPPGSPSEAVTEQLDPHLLTYVSDTADYAHIEIQGPYYIGPGYVNQYGNWIDGAYIDVDLSGATTLGAPLDDISYGAVYDSDPNSCPDATAGPLLAQALDTVVPSAVPPGQSFADGNYGYGGCVDAAGGSSQPGIDPFSAS